MSHATAATTAAAGTDVTFFNVNVLDTKHAGVEVLRKNDMWAPAEIAWHGGLLVGQSGPEVCSMCLTRISEPTNMDSGCAPKLTLSSYEVGVRVYGAGLDPRPPWDPNPDFWTLAHPFIHWALSCIIILDGCSHSALTEACPPCSQHHAPPLTAACPPPSCLE